jgi:hypothetical protein
MTVTVSQVSNTQTFGAWFEKFNLVANIISQNTVTVDTTTTGSVSTGNGIVNGYFGANTFVVLTNLTGGTLGTAANLSITSQVNISNNIVLNNSLLYANSTANLAVVSSNVYNFPATGTGTANVVDTYSTSSYRTAEYTMQVTSINTGAIYYQASRILIAHDGTTPLITEYAIMSTYTAGAPLGVFTSAISGGALNLNFTPSVTNCVVKFVKSLITV